MLNSIARECVSCGDLFIACKARQRRCRPTCRDDRDRSKDRRASQDKHRVRAAVRAMPEIFIGVDGEGVTLPDGTHRYVLLTVGDRSLSLNGEHLPFHTICHFLWDCFLSDPEAVFVGFYLKYDFAQWLRTLPEERARMLLSKEGIAKRQRTAAEHLPPFPVQYKHPGDDTKWEFDYLPGKRFKLRKVERGASRWMYICDAGSYFQMSFLKAINPKGNPNPVVSQDEYAIIEKGKERREHATLDPEMEEYNKLECDVLARLMEQLDQGAREEDLSPKRDQWHGPGQLAQMWMRKIKLGTGEQHREVVPEPVREAARCSYFGGWFELFWHGPVPGTSWSYDINSAYPYIMSQMPCLLHGDWTHTNGGGRPPTRERRNELLSGHRLIRARLEGSHSLVGAMLHRNHNRTILRPRQTEGWFWASELRAAFDAAFIDRVRMYECWTYTPCDCPPPLGPIAELYEGRLRVGKNSPSGKARKLIYNSAAGKQMQSVGKPVFGNPVYASMITSGTRRMIAEAIGSHPGGAGELLMVATDGVTFRSRHTGLELDATRLGAWDETRHENLSLFMTGVYWDNESRSRIAAGDAPAFKSRGVSAKDIASHIARMDAQWDAWNGEWPELAIPVKFQLVSPKQALRRKRWDLCGTVITADKPETWPERNGERIRPDRTVSANPYAKRVATGPGPSRPYDRPDPLESLPYDGSFGDELRERQDAEYGDNPDGPVERIMAEALLDN